MHVLSLPVQDREFRPKASRANRCQLVCNTTHGYVLITTTVCCQIMCDVCGPFPGYSRHQGLRSGLPVWPASDLGTSKLAQSHTGGRARNPHPGIQVILAAPPRPLQRQSGDFEFPPQVPVHTELSQLPLAYTSQKDSTQVEYLCHQTASLLLERADGFV